MAKILINQLIEKTFVNELTVLLIDNPNKRMFIADSAGTVFIYGLDVAD